MITVKRAGLLTIIQDLGRCGFQKYGVIVSGAMDQTSHRIANILVGNDENEPTVEMTLVGPTFQFQEDALIAICGGDLSATINGIPVHLWRPIYVKKNSELKFSACRNGCRAYLAVAGGFKIDKVLNSKSTYLRAGIGGLNGSALQTGDQLSVGHYSILAKKISSSLSKQVKNGYFESKWGVNPKRLTATQHKNIKEIRVIRGRQYDWFTEESQKHFFRSPYTITNQSDRMGYRLQGAKLTLATEQEMISEAVNFGTIQVPPDGKPIILLADRQTTGGYPKIGQVIQVDLPIIAQAKPGEKLCFSEISLTEAHYLYMEREKYINEIKNGIQLKFN
jgi:antagonist of KipI